MTRFGAFVLAWFVLRVKLGSLFGAATRAFGGRRSLPMSMTRDEIFFAAFGQIVFLAGAAVLMTQALRRRIDDVDNVFGTIGTILMVEGVRVLLTKLFVTGIMLEIL